MRHRKLCVVAVFLCVGVSAFGQIQQGKLETQAFEGSGISRLKEINPDLDGNGVKIGIISRSFTYLDGEPQNDYRPNITHKCFSGIQFGFHEDNDPAAGVSPHITTICSLLFGEDANAVSEPLGKFSFEGVVPSAKADVYEFWHFLLDNVLTGQVPDSNILSLSIGSPQEDWWTRGIEAMAEHNNKIIVAAIGNGSDAFDQSLYPAAGSNIIGVGVVDSAKTGDVATNIANYSLAVPQHTSTGPTVDGRSKPDIVVPSNCIAANGSEPNSYETIGNWSSFSTPIVAGAVGLMLQKAKEDPNLLQGIFAEGGNCAIKAILLSSARKLPYWHKGKCSKTDDHIVPLDYVQGAGMLDVAEAYDLLISGPNEPGKVSSRGWDNNVIDANESLQKDYKFILPEPANKRITATLTWNNHYTPGYPFEPLPDKNVHLRLEVWAIDANDPNNNYLVDYSDSKVDNLQHIYCFADANYKNYEIVVSYSDANENSILLPEQYGLAWNIADKEDNNDIYLYDLNADGVVNGQDFIILLGNLQQSLISPDSYFIGDIDSNGRLDIEDLKIFLQNINRKAPWYIEPTAFAK